MSQSLMQMYVHLVFHRKCTAPDIVAEHQSEIHAYMAATLKRMGAHPIVVGGVGDHVHLLFSMPREHSMAEIVSKLKASTTRRLKEKDAVRYRSFFWQSGYGAFSVSPSRLSDTKSYILNQAEHHRRKSVREEYLQILNAYGVAYNEEYLLTD